MIQHGNKWVIEDKDCFFESVIKNIWIGINNDCCKWLSGALEYLAAEIYELTVQITKLCKRVIVKEQYIMAAILRDVELNSIFQGVMAIPDDKKTTVQKVISKSGN